jgi:two-component system LytT family response regulator
MKKEVSIGSRTRVLPDEIIQLEAKQDYTVIHFKDGSSLLSSTTLGTLEKRLQSYAFFRVNRSTVINLNHLSRFTVLAYKAKGQRENSRKKNTTEIFFSRRRVAAFEACVSA